MIDYVIEILHEVFSRINKPDFGKYIDVVCSPNIKGEAMQILRPNIVGSSEDCPEINGLPWCQPMLEETVLS